MPSTVGWRQHRCNIIVGVGLRDMGKATAPLERIHAR
jgi:hypothetical protein